MEYVPYVAPIPLALRERYEADAALMQPCERIGPAVLAAAMEYMGTTGRPLVKMAVCKSYQVARQRYRAVASWLHPDGELEAWALRRGPVWEVWLGRTAAADIETARSPWWGKHPRRRTTP